MTPKMEQRLRHALRQGAETVQAPPGAWEGIRARIEPGRQRRLARPGAHLAVGAAVVLVAVVLAATLRGNDANRLEVAAGPGRLYLAPSAVDGFRLVYAVIDPPRAQLPRPHRGDAGVRSTRWRWGGVVGLRRGQGAGRATLGRARGGPAARR